MQKEYEAVYRCRLCGKVYVDGVIKCTNTEAVTILCKEKRYMSGMTSVHLCDDGSFGVSDFQGLS